MNKVRVATMYIKNRRNSNEIKDFSSYQPLCLTESFVLSNRLLSIYQHVANNLKKILYISIFFSLISCSSLFLPKTQTEIEKEYLRIENSKKILIDSVILKRGIDYNRGNNVEIKK